MNATYPLWLLGVAIRYGILLPMRLSVLCGGMTLFLLLLLLLLHFLPSVGGGREREWLFCFGCKVWLLALGAIVRHHGEKRRERVPHLYVANHTSFTDYFILSAHRFPHAALAQVHGGLFGLFQRYLLSALGSLTFNRAERRDRQTISERMRAHASDPDAAPLLVFPEGTCVNNEATVLFHKGAFDLGVGIVPVAIKYNKRLLDPYWNTREQTFTRHILYLMTRWLMVVDVHWLPLQQQQSTISESASTTLDPDINAPVVSESAIDFSNRVKEMISEAAGLTNLSWDGYMKNYLRAAGRDKLLLRIQHQYAQAVKNDLQHRSLNQSDITGPKANPMQDNVAISEKVKRKKHRSMSAMTLEELERHRSSSPLHQLFVFPEWLSEHSLVDIKNSLMNRRFRSSSPPLLPEDNNN